MDLSQYVIGVDIGTTSTKAVLFHANGMVMDSAYEFYPLIKEKPEFAEQELSAIYQAVLSTIKQVIVSSKIPAEQIVNVSFSSAMHSLILMDGNDQPLTRSITWADNRANRCAEELKLGNGSDIYQRTGTPIHPMSPLCKIIWFKEQQLEVFQQAVKFIGVKEYVFYQLFGKYVVDYSVASSTGLFNIHDLSWDTMALKEAGITAEQLPLAVTPTTQVSGMKEEIAQELGLNPQTPFVLGGSDGCLSNLGVGAIEPKNVAITIGTSAAVRMVTEKPYLDTDERTFCYVLDENHYVVGGAINNGGVVMDWAKNQFFNPAFLEENTDEYSDMMELIASVPAGSNGLLFHPYLNGERAPLWQGEARGSFFGIHLMHKQKHFLRAVLEGICLNIYDVLHEITEQAGRPDKIIATGGFSQSPVWRQLLTDVVQQDVFMPESYESSCLGAVVIGLKSAGMIADLKVVKSMIGSEHQHKPNEIESAVYKEIFPLYRKLSRQFSQNFMELGLLQEKVAITETIIK
ncbi:gluconokinase [Desemzia sp. FAM 23989]|uniref:gluconokinase n=1 Tax=Desemzia sp. FAM 23989 TaxID=3259523 RepID=UPI0038853481